MVKRRLKLNSGWALALKNSPGNYLPEFGQLSSGAFLRKFLSLLETLLILRTHSNLDNSDVRIWYHWFPKRNHENAANIDWCSLKAHWSARNGVLNHVLSTQSDDNSITWQNYRNICIEVAPWHCVHKPHDCYSPAVLSAKRKLIGRDIGVGFILSGPLSCHPRGGPFIQPDAASWHCGHNPHDCHLTAILSTWLKPLRRGTLQNLSALWGTPFLA